MGPPSSGGVAVLQILGLLEHFDMAGLGASVDGMQALLEASKLAFADRNLYLADSDFVRVPVQGAARPGLSDGAGAADPPRRLHGQGRRRQPAMAFDASCWRRTRATSCPGTSQIVIVDADGNALSMTTTIESNFGSGLMVGGFLLNNELTDFSFTPPSTAGRSPTGSRPASGRAARWRRPSCSTRPARPAS